VEERAAGRSYMQAGIVTGLWRYPVKSMAGQALDSVGISWAGLEGDRRWGFVRPDSGSSGFPWHTIREFPQMSSYAALLNEPGRPDRSRVFVQSPGGGQYEVTDARLAAELGTGLRVMRLDRGTFDAMPVSVISDSTVSTLCALAGVASNELRFRPNIVVALDSGTPFEEENWAGAAVRIGAAIVRIDRKDSRCIVVNVDPVTGLPGAGLLKVIGSTRRACAGVYGTTVLPGLIRVGDPVILEKQPQDQAGSQVSAGPGKARGAGQP
jgi:uncharacterized protein